MSIRRPRVSWHTTAGAIVAAYLLAAAVVVLAHGIVPVPAWWPMVLRTRMNDAAAPRVAHLVLWLAGGGLAVAVAALLASPYLPLATGWPRVGWPAIWRAPRPHWCLR